MFRVVQRLIPVVSILSCRGALRNAVTCLSIILLLASSFSTGLIGGEDNRRILALYDSTEVPARSGNAHQLLEMPLNRLGLMAEYADVNHRPLPDYTPYRAIVVWFADNKMTAPNQYLEWLASAANAGVRLIIISQLGADTDESGKTVNQEKIRSVWRAMDLEQGNIPSLTNPFSVKRLLLKPEVFGFEVQEPLEPPTFYDFHITGKGLEPWLSITHPDAPDSPGVAIAAGPKGGFITDEQICGSSVETPVWHFRWFLNPFKFLAAAAGVKDISPGSEQPVGNLRPDVTTVFGCRAAFSQIDGDGMHNLTQDIPGGTRLAADVLHDQILTRYPVPITVSYIAAETTTAGGADEPFLQKLRKIMNLPNVTPAAHGYTHPMIWATGVCALKIPGYQFDPKMETAGAIDLVTKNTCPPDKRAELFLWTGDCLATPAALAALAERDFLNMNGGDSRYDAIYNSISCISPLSMPIAPNRQVYAAACNEFLYTDGWRENFGGFAYVLDTFRNTAEPRYLPVDIYYHNYLCERQAGVLSLQKVYDWAIKQDLCWLTAPEYCRSVQAFFACRTGRDDGRWWIEDYAGLNTVRLDGETGHPDMTRCVNVAGYSHFADSLYVSLLPGKRAEIVLQDQEGDILFLRRSTALLQEVSLTPQRLRARARLAAPGFLEIGGTGAAPLAAIVEGKPVAVQNGRIALAGGYRWVDLEITRGAPVRAETVGK